MIENGQVTDLSRKAFTLETTPLTLAKTKPLDPVIPPGLKESSAL